jgi:hypothetical protein
MERDNYNDIIGKPYRLKSSITARPDYFNERGHMDHYIDSRTIIIPFEMYKTEWGMFVRVADKTAKTYETWSIKLNDIEPIEMDNRRIEDV